MKFIKPKIVISKCLEFESCRYDGQLISNQHIKQLKDYIDFLPICPEVEIGMGTPRSPIKIVETKKNIKLYQVETNRDYYSKMNKFSNDFINNLEEVDGFILKSKSPSCGVKTARIYAKELPSPIIRKGNGIFTKNIIKAFPNHPIEEETRLNNVFLREHFYTIIFTIADFRKVYNIKELYKFHTKHKYLLMSYNQLAMTKMGRIAADIKKKSFIIGRDRYYKHLLNIFSKRARYTSNINTLMHVMGYFKNQLSVKEKKHFLDLLDQYRNKKVPLSSPSALLASWIYRFNNEYLMKQSFFNPFPKQLVEPNNSRFI